MNMFLSPNQVCVHTFSLFFGPHEMFLTRFSRSSSETLLPESATEENKIPTISPKAFRLIGNPINGAWK